MHSIFVGFDPRETAAYAVLRESIRNHITQPLPVTGLVLSDLQEQGLYWRPTKHKDGRLFDVISDHPMATEFAISRFLVPHLAREGWALFMDCDMMFRSNPARVFEGLDHTKAVYCVKHNHVPDNIEKMDGQVQSQYPRKNWSSFVVFNCGHEANQKLTPHYVNSLPGRDLHRFCWLEDDQIGELPVEWNWLAGHSDPKLFPKNVHWTDGGPWFEEYHNAAYADEWRANLHRWAA